MERSRLELMKKLKAGKAASQATGGAAAGTQTSEATEEPLFGTEL
jgi:hypothetical protein